MCHGGVVSYGYSVSMIETTEVPRSLQRRTIALLSLAQIFSGIGTGAVVSVGSLLAVKLSGSTSWGGSVTTVMTLGAALSSMPLARWALRHGRRKTLSGGLLVAALGAVLMIVATSLSSFPVLLLGAATLGVGSAVNLQARFAATDLSRPEHRARDLSLVVWTTTVGSVAGPNMLGVSERVGAALGLPEFAGIFVFSTIGMLLASSVIMIGLRPDPYLLAKSLRERASAAGATQCGAAPVPAAPERLGFRVTLHKLRGNWAAIGGLITILAGHAIMVSIMSVTSVHLNQHGATLTIIGLTISLHIAGMYALSPVMGVISDRVGPVRTAIGGFTVLIAAAAAAGLAGGDQFWVGVGLVLLGLGWSATTIPGAAQIISAVDSEIRVSVQGVSDTLMSLAGAMGGLLAGLGLYGLGYGGLNAGAALVAAAAIVAVWKLSTRRA